ncbi:hypothetical protein WR25_06740 isoform A [Diploscapter pachys]|uniref:alpha-1,6-mannosyl-glycoprotein 6-beta-N-acetylglucosaminyltransferase n=2 Tax=Diploscapter pachys TaxID=2018661 RepID=A0A2A2LY48_9BILA|nr:hypothetical protein WR25_06740 isoform A [Diploscapter pachys]
MKRGWKMHQCYQDYGADNTVCSHREYLSKIEKFCPPMKLHKSKFSVTKVKKLPPDYAQMNRNMTDLFSKMSDVPRNYIYHKKRIERMWSQWSKAAATNWEKHPGAMSGRRKQNILVHMGFLAKESKLNFAEKSKEGGPLGELLQWSDLIASLHILGHQLYISTDKGTLKNVIEEAERAPPCPTMDGKSKRIDLIITDIMGLRGLKKHRAFLVNNKCRIRLVDSFGTHVEFTDKFYFRDHKKELSGSVPKNPWGGHGLAPQQHWTFFPHTDDNTFLGFAVDQPLEEIRPMFDRQSSKAVLVYGKEQYMWKGLEDVIQSVKEVAEVHATVADASTGSPMFADVVNHGLLDTNRLYSLLRSVKVFLGIGFPLEGPAPFEAIAQGAVYINAQFNPPKSRLNDGFLAEKPTLREFTSQLPYAERIGRPYAITVDIHNSTLLKKAIQEALLLNPSPYVPKELSTEGMLLRLALLVEKQDFCNPDKTDSWPPANQMQVIIASPGESCEVACDKKNLVCEPTFFRLLDSPSILQKHFSACNKSSVTSAASVLAPYDCVLQDKPMLFSCASKERVDSKSNNKYPPKNRICPCRSVSETDRAICGVCLKI